MPPQSLGEKVDKDSVTTFRLDDTISNYEMILSDHRPVGWRFTLPAPSTIPRIVVNEIMQNPKKVYDSDGEWFELYNADDVSFDLRGWTILDNGSNFHVIQAEDSLIIESGQYFVLGRKSDITINGGVEVDYEYSSFVLENIDDEIILLNADSVEVDRVEYDGGPAFPVPDGSSMALLDPNLDNSEGSNWIESTVSFGNGDLGTPGSFNFPYFGPVWHVTTSGSDVTGDGSKETPFFSIQHGIESATDGDTILVHPGTYLENISFRGKNLVLGSLFLDVGDTSYIYRTIIDGDSTGSVVTVNEGEDSTTMLIGFSLINGHADRGGGIFIKESNPTISDCFIRNNSAVYYGGGVYLQGSNSIFTHCYISDNWITEGITPSFLGAGIYCLDSNPWITNSTLDGNWGSIVGGIACDSSNPTIIHCTVNQNEGFSTGGIFCLNNSNPRLVNSILWENLPNEVYFASYGDSNSITFTYSDISQGEGGIEVSGYGTVNWLAGNINENPQFLDPKNDDYRLDEVSPCIDAGTPLFVWSGDTIVNFPPEQYIGSAPDMGAYEYGTIAVREKQDFFPVSFFLYQNFPNPFNAETIIAYDLPIRSKVTLSIFDLLGQRVSSLINEVQEAGKKSIIWDGMDDFGKPLSSGIYIYWISVGSLNEVAQARKMILLK